MNQITLYDNFGTVIGSILAPFFAPTGNRQEPVIEFRGRTFVWCQDNYRFEERARFVASEGTLHR